MSEKGAGEKTEQATPKKLADAFKKGQFAKSQEIQTLAVVGAGTVALIASAKSIWEKFMLSSIEILGGLDYLEVTMEQIPAYVNTSALFVTGAVAPVVLPIMAAGAIAGLAQTKFRPTPDVVELNWGKLNPISGMKRIVSPHSWATTAFSSFKLLALGSVLASELFKISQSPIFFSAISVADIGKFLASTTVSILLKAALLMIFIALGDYLYQMWKTSKDLMMDKEEVKEESKNAEGDPKMKSRRQQMRVTMLNKQMINRVPDADVIVTNPTHFAVALKYEKGTDKAPIVIAKGANRLAQQMKGAAREADVPMMENVPLAQGLYKYANVDQEIPIPFYEAVAEVLAAVYRLYPYRTHAKRSGS